MICCNDKFIKDEDFTKYVEEHQNEIIDENGDICFNWKINVNPIYYGVDNNEEELNIPFGVIELPETLHFVDESVKTLNIPRTVSLINPFFFNNFKDLKKLCIENGCLANIEPIRSLSGECVIEFYSKDKSTGNVVVTHTSTVDEVVRCYGQHYNYRADNIATLIQLYVGKGKTNGNEMTSSETVADEGGMS